MARIVMESAGRPSPTSATSATSRATSKREVDAGHEVAVVVSAMAGETDELVGWARERRRCTTRANTTSSSPPASR